MKFIWEEKDIVCGKIICKNPSDGKFSAGGQANLTYKIGFVGGSSTFSPRTEKLDSSGVCLISMTDGMVTQAKSKKDLADTLNKGEYIPMPHKWFLEIVDFLRDCY